MAEHSQDPFVPIVDEDGRVTGVMDQMAADYLASTDPDPTQATLDAAFERVTRVRLVGSRHEGRFLMWDVVHVDVTDPTSLAELAAALRIVEAQEYGHILGIGDHQLELWAGEEQIPPLEVFELRSSSGRRSVGPRSGDPTQSSQNRGD
jgi:hypothetical protein